MSSLFTAAETALGHLAIDECVGDGLDVVVGGLGLGYTALAVLEHDRVASLVVVDALAEVIDWHERGLIPAGTVLTADDRCQLHHGDFFAGMRDEEKLDPSHPGRLWHAIVVDIDHTPRHYLHPSNADLYDARGLSRVAAKLHPGGVFALWSNDLPDDEFVAVLAEAFVETRAEVVTFHNPLQNRPASNTVYLGRTPA